MPSRLHAVLNLIDWLYLAYLAAMAMLAAWRSPSWPTILLMHALIAGAILLSAANREKSPAIRFLHDWYPLAMFIFSFEEVARFSLSLVPHWQNDFLVHIEHSIFGVSPNAWIHRVRASWISEILDAGYFSYYSMFPLVGGFLYAQQDKRPFRRLMASSVLMYYMCFAVYLVFPTQSPLHAGHAALGNSDGALFSWLVQMVQRQAGVHGNAFPSSHVALAVICAAYAWRYVRALRWALTVCLLLICISSIYDGYHYLSDVLAGILVALTALWLESLMNGLACKPFRRHLA